MTGQRSKKLASASFFCGLASLVFFALAGVPAILLGHKAVSAANRDGRGVSGFAITGLVLGYLSLLSSLVLGLIALGFAAGRSALAKAKEARATAELFELTHAVESFYGEYGRVPHPTASQPMTSTAPLIDTLRGANPAENPRSITFLTHPSSDQRDPWGRPYFILLDTDDDKTLDDPLTGRPLHGRRAIAWSAGPDGLIDPASPSDPVNRDNIYSWR